MDLICRICLLDIPLINSVSILWKVYKGKTISDIMFECASVQIFENDSFPKYLCLKCYEKLTVFSAFRQLIIDSDIQLKQKALLLKDEPSIQTNVELNTDILNKSHLVEIDIKEEPNNVSEHFDAKYSTKSDMKLLKEHSINNKVLRSEFENCDMSDDDFVKDECSSISDNSIEHTSIYDDKNKKSSENVNTTEVGLKPGRKPSKNLKDNRKIHEFKCNICHKTLYGRSNRLKQHILMAHSDIKNHVCEVCEKKFKSKQQLVNHRRIHTGEKPYECEFCQEKFTSPQNLFNHKKKHTGDYKNYKCDTCTKGYSTPGELETHKRITHTGEKPFLCEICSKAYSSVRNLGLHIRSVHEKNEKCSKCGLMLSVKRLKQHLQQHKDREEGIRRYTCDKCGKGFFSSHALRKHQVVHTGEKPYSCDLCQKSFSQKFAVVTHMRVHSDVRSFSCEFCVKTFKYKQHLQLHLKKHHEEDKIVIFQPE